MAHDHSICYKTLEYFISQPEKLLMINFAKFMHALVTYPSILKFNTQICDKLINT